MVEMESGLAHDTGAEEKRAAAELAVGLSPENKRDVVIEVMKTLPRENRKSVAAEMVGDLSDENKKDVAADAAGDLGVEGRKDVAVRLADDMSRKDRAELIQRMLPTQTVADFVWRVVIVSFAVVFVGSAGALVAAALWNPAEIQTLLTVVTTVAGFLAGFLSGKAGE